MSVNKIISKGVYYSIAPTLLTVPSTIAASTAAKTTSTTSNITLEEGNQIILKLVNGNTATNPTLSINGGTAKSIVGSGFCVPSQFSNTNALMHLTYDGTSWLITG